MLPIFLYFEKGQTMNPETKKSTPLKSYSEQTFGLDHSFDFNSYFWTGYNDPDGKHIQNVLRLTNNAQIEELCNIFKKKFKEHCPELVLKTGFYKVNTDWNGDYVKYSAMQDGIYNARRQWRGWHAWIPEKESFLPESLGIFGINKYVDWESETKHNYILYFPTVTIIGDIHVTNDDSFVKADYTITALTCEADIDIYLKRFNEAWHKYKRATEYVKNMKKQMREKIKFILSTQDI